MQSFSPAFNRLAGLISRLPGIGKKSAERLAYHILKSPSSYARQLAEELGSIHDKILFCSRCGLMTEEDPCVICTSTRRDPAIVCVVETPADALNIEKTAEFRGLYHVLKGAISPLNKVRPEDLRIAALKNRVENEPIKEIILATNPTVEGDTTALYIAAMLKESGIKITRIARGLPMGGDLEFADALTLSRALQHRDILS